MAQLDERLKYPKPAAKKGILKELICGYVTGPYAGNDFYGRSVWVLWQPINVCRLDNPTKCFFIRNLIGPNFKERLTISFAICSSTGSHYDTSSVTPVRQ